mmetsp:Transcript_33011/g.104636  ORF Transcript_33011/g.104636 Transcript_33011/m.104636 type:complete len:272 (+) Transcript_33011:369-1184(+)
MGGADLGWRRPGGVGECQITPALPPALATLGIALAPLLPGAPGAEGLITALAGAAAGLLVREWLAIGAAKLRVLRDAPEALPLAAALGASAPVLPVAVGAGHRCAAAAVTAALPDLGQGPVAGHAAVLGRPENLPAPAAPASATSGTALAPLRPAAKLAVHGRCLRTLCRRICTRDRIAGEGLLQASDAEGPISPAILADAPRAPLRAAAGGGATAPLAPLGELAVYRCLAALANVAELHLPIVASSRGPAVRGHHGDLARAERDASATRL